MDLGRVRTAIERADVVLSGGGGLLQNVTSLRSLLYYAGVIRAGIRAGKPTMIFAQSIGPLDFWGRAIVRNFCKGIAGATVRDERSRALLSSLLPGVAVERSADPVFLLEPAASRSTSPPKVWPATAARWSSSRCASGRAPTRPRARSPASSTGSPAEHGARVAFLPMGGPPDAEVATTIIRRCASTPGAAARLSARSRGAGHRRARRW